MTIRCLSFSLAALGSSDSSGFCLLTDNETRLAAQHSFSFNITVHVKSCSSGCPTLKPHKATNQVAMMASIGLVGQHFLKFPGFENSPAGFSIMGRGEGVLGFFAIFLLSGVLELAWREDPSGEKEPGNYGDPFGVQMYNDEMRLKELNNGRMAMISVLGIFAAECATGKDAMQQFGLPALGAGRFVSASSRTSFTGKTSLQGNAQQSVMRRAEAVVEDVPPPPFQPSEQFGATEPLGFFDPLGFTAVGDETGFRKLRVSEIKHGRAA